MARSTFSRRDALRLGALASVTATAAVLAACGAAAAPTAAPPAKSSGAAPQPTTVGAATSAPTAAEAAKTGAGETVLVYWTFMPTDQRFPGRKTLFPQWGEKHNARIQIEELQAGAPFTQKMAASSAAKLLPDLLDPDQSLAVNNFSSQGWLTPVDDILAESGKDDFFKIGVTFGTFKGKLYGMPLLGYPHLMHYRKDWFEEEGIKPPTDWSELLPVCQKLNGKNKGGAEIAAISGYFKGDHAPPFFQNMVGPNNGYMFDETGKLVITSNEVQEAMQHVRDLKPFFQAGYVNMDYGDTRNQFIEGKIAIEMDSTSMANLIVKAKPELGQKVTSVLLPWGPSSKHNRSGFNGISYFSIGSQTKYVDLAKDFLKWFFSPPIYLEAFKSYDWGLIPERRAVSENPDWRKALPEQARPIIEAGVKAAEIATFPGEDFGPNPISNKLLTEDVYRNLLQRVADGKDDIKTSLDWAAGEIKRIQKES